jgi:hypothetical protein
VDQLSQRVKYLSQRWPLYPVPDERHEALVVRCVRPWVPTVTAAETDLVSTRVGDYQYVPTIGGLIDQLWIR